MRAMAGFKGIAGRVAAGRSDGGFVLTELLVVIIVTAFAAILLHAGVSGDREKAKQTICMKNLQQVGITAHLYAENHDGYLIPRMIRNRPTGFGQYGYADPLMAAGLMSTERGEAGKLWECPSKGESFDYASGGTYSYGYNGRFTATDLMYDDGVWTGGIKLEDLNEPAKLMNFSEPYGARVVYPVGMASENTWVDFRHDRNVNILFYDGSVESWTSDELPDRENPNAPPWRE